jgi:DNA-binding LacI/PurR family transcriptional regulator
LAAQERFVGFKEKMVELGLPVNEDYIFSSESYSYDDGYEVGKKFLELDHYPTAMFVVSDIVAMGFIKALKDGGLKVPEDVSVIGFDDLPFAKQFEPSLSTIRQDARVLGEKAAHKLLELMENKTENRTGIEKIPVELMVRDSVKSSKQ